MTALSHPNCLPLLDHAIVPVAGGGGGGVGGSGGGFNGSSGVNTSSSSLHPHAPLAAGGGGGGGSSGGRGYIAWLLFPAYEDGTLAEELQRLAAAGRRLATGDVLDIFEQVGVLKLSIFLAVLVSLRSCCAARTSAH